MVVSISRRSKAGTIKSTSGRVSWRPRKPAGWLMARSLSDMTARSINTTCMASPIAMAIPVLAVGARFSGPNTKSSDPSITTFHPWAIFAVKCYDQEIAM